jgi:hypothetical protein
MLTHIDLKYGAAPKLIRLAKSGIIRIATKGKNG